MAMLFDTDPETIRQKLATLGRRTPLVAARHSSTTGHPGHGHQHG
jgi:hypothetical protein